MSTTATQKSEPKVATKDPVAALPTTFPADQLFVAVSDNDGPAAGFDGGPEKGGSGAWPRGAIRQWTAESAVPLALRDPSNGTIVRGYIEPVEELGERHGQPVALRSGKFFAERSASGEWVAKAPSKKALQRAIGGAGTYAKPLQAFTQQQARANEQRLAGMGLNVNLGG